MYLKQLELNGFKSFAESTRLKFSQGITAIVGPNGSGKSNVADAIRWILGEQSMKNIRSQSSKDLIFSGSKTRNKLGKASVSLCFDNSGGAIPLDYTEIVISRSIFRDGTSEYFINKNTTKLIDLVEILAKANIGHRGFSVINQGMEAEILKYSPSELYELIEEASGVRYLQIKKKRAERRLKATETNLEKASAILNELVPHLKFLKHEATKAERREKIKQRLAEIQKQFFFFKINDLEKQNNGLSKEKDTLETKALKLNKEISGLNDELKKEESSIKNSQNKFIGIQQELEEILDQRAKLSEESANLKAQIQIAKERQPIKTKKQFNIDIHQVEEEFKSIRSALEKILKFDNLAKVKEEINRVLIKIEKLIGNSDLALKIKDASSEEVNRLLIKQEELEQVVNEINGQYENRKNSLKNSQEGWSQERFFELERELRDKKDNLSSVESRLKEIRWLEEQAEENWKVLKQDILASEMNYDEIKNEKNLAAASEPIEQLEEKINRLKYQAEEIGSVDEMTLQEYKETKERYEKLSKKLEDLKKAKEDLNDLIIKLTKEIREEFDKSFEVIDDNFNKYVRLLFGGGKGYLKQIHSMPPAKMAEELSAESSEEEGDAANLSEEEILEEEEVSGRGLEIKVILPGKKVSDIRMFSGGEKALTSVALLFAIVSSNPPPFLVLDEADATLDESNSLRFAKLLGEFGKNTQFIVITHNRETMNQANVLYGVTMGEDGVSSLLSLKLEK